MKQEIINYLPQKIAEIIQNMSRWLKDDILEIRLRVNQPLQVITCKQDLYLNSKGEQVTNLKKGYQVKKEHLKKGMLLLSDNSLYALERQLVEGFITIPAGHRVGFTGQVITEKGKIKTIKNINSLNYRITREKIGIGEKVINKIYNFKKDYLYNTLIVSPPLCGKTTLLRDLIRVISEGVYSLGFQGKKVGVVDERSEIAGAYNGVAQNKIGNKTDLLDNCPKAYGVLLLIRSMSPEVIAFDELGSKEDMMAIKEAISAGVSLLCTIHGQDLDNLRLGSSFKEKIKEEYFQRYIILSKNKGVGTIEKVMDNQGKEVI